MFRYLSSSRIQNFITYTICFQAKLPAVLRLCRDTLTADMKIAIKNAVAELLPVLVSRPLESEMAPGKLTVDADGEMLTIFAINI